MQKTKNDTNSKKNNLKQLWGVLNQQQKKNIVTLIIYSIITGILDLLSIGLIIPYVGIISGGGLESHKFFEIFAKIAPNSVSLLSISSISAVFIIILITAILARIAILHYSTKITFEIGAELARDLIKKWIFLDYQAKKETDSAEVVTLLNTKVNDVILNVIFPSITLASALIFSLMISLYLFYLVPDLTVLMLVIVLLAYSIIAFIQKNKVNKLSKVVADSQHKATKVLIDILTASKEIIINKKQDAFTSKFSDESKKYRSAQGEIMFLAYSPRYILEGVGVALMIAITNILIIQKSPIEVFAIMGTIALGVQKLLPNLQQAYSSITLIKGSQNTIKDFLKMWGQSSDIDFTGKIDLKYTRNFSVTIKSFRYKNIEILRDINLVIPKNTSVALIAPSGAGKSTIVDALLGFLNSEDIRVAVDEKTITPEYFESWRGLISYLPQSMYIYDTDVISNITCYGPSVVDAVRLKLALEITEISDNFGFCLSTHLVGDNGSKLSGGQRQRIGLARAIYSDRPIIILDEATNALDMAAEKAIISKIVSMSGKTLFAITHRLELLNVFDRIAYINSQKFVISGILDEMILCDSEFKRFVTSGEKSH